MDQTEYDNLITIATDDKPFTARVRLQEYLKTVTVGEEEKPKAKRTDNQNRAYWLWLTQIEHEAANQGVTWNMVMKHTNQIKVTKENVHEAVKQLTEALWGITSTTQLHKTGHLDTLIDHVTDLFGKAGLELPPFPSQEAPTTLDNIEEAKKLDYPEMDENTLADKF